MTPPRQQSSGDDARSARRSAPRSARWPGALLRIALLAILATAVAFRMRALDHLPGLNGDEAWYGAWAMDFLHGHGVPWRTPTGNPVNLLFLGPLCLLHAFGGPSIALLRVVPLASGLAALAVNWWFCRRLFGTATAIVSTLALAVLPINIAYSRFAWDASQSLLATLPVYYLALTAARRTERRFRLFALAAVFLFLAAWVHPTNLLAAAMLAAAATVTPRIPAAEARDESPASRRRARWAAILLLIGVGGASLVTAGVVLSLLNPAMLLSRMQGVRALLQPHGLAVTAALFARLFVGQTVYSDIVGSRSWTLWPAAHVEQFFGLDVLLFWLLLGWSAWRVASALRSDRRDATASPHNPAATSNPADRALVGGWALAVAGFALLAGPFALSPGYERYAVVLVAPTVLLVSRAFAVQWVRRPRGRPILAILAVAAAALLLLDFDRHYFTALKRTGGQSQNAFRTAAVEPKQAAADWLRRYAAEHRSADAGNLAVRVATDDYWLYWPLRYLLSDDKQIILEFATPAEHPSPGWEYIEQAAPADAAARRVQVEFDNSPNAKTLQAAGAQTLRRIEDAAGHPLIWIGRPPAPDSAAADRARAPVAPKTTH